MGKVLVTNHVSLDGVMQAPAAPEEDTREGFEHGGWAAVNQDEVMASVMAEGMKSGRESTDGGLLFGRHTYEHFYEVWPKRTDGNPYTEVLNRAQKYVCSNTLSDPLPWQNSTLLRGDAPDTVAELKARLAGDLMILGSGELIQSLMRRQLIDGFLLPIHPVVLGSGRRLFAEGGAYAKFRLVDVTPTTTGVLIANYELAR
jgi:dihydrofolate reductase